MNHLGITVWLLLALAALAQSVLLIVQTWEHRRLAHGRRQSRRFHQRDLGRVAVIVPCKGLDYQLRENLALLFEQDYANYELMFVVEAADDPAWRVIRSLMDDYPQRRAQLLFAGRSSSTGAKVHSLRLATGMLAPEITLLAFVDSDVRPPRDWLRLMVTRLVRKSEVGAVTGYRWFVPRRATLGRCLLYSVNNSLASLFTGGGRHLLWGGSWAIRREVFDRLQIRAGWKGQLSDDLVASRILQQAGLRIVFEPGCMVPSPLVGGLGDAFAFLRRQHQIGRAYVPRWWFAMMCGTLLAVLGFWSTIALAIYAAMINADWLELPLWLATLLYLSSLIRGLVRWPLARWYLGQRTSTLVIATWFDLLAAPVSGLFSLAAMLASLTGRRICWRGCDYKLAVDGQVERVVATRNALVHREGVVDRDLGSDLAVLSA